MNLIYTNGEIFYTVFLYTTYYLLRCHEAYGVVSIAKLHSDRQISISYSYTYLQQLEKQVDKNLLNKRKTPYLLTVKTYQ